MLKIFLVFLRVGLFSFGGGNAAMPYIKYETVEKNKWISEDEFFELVAITNSLPGPNMVQVCSYIGYKTLKMRGLLAASFAILGPNAILFTIAVLLFKDRIDVDTMDKIATGSMWFVLALLINLCFKLIMKSWSSKANKLVLLLLLGMSLTMMIYGVLTPFIIISALLVIYLYTILFDKTKAELDVKTVEEDIVEGGVM